MVTVYKGEDFEAEINKNLDEGWVYVGPINLFRGESQDVALQKMDFAHSSEKPRPTEGFSPRKLLQEENQTLTETIAKLQRELAERNSLVRDLINKPIEMFLKCPQCAAPHIDKEAWATKPHRTHLCEYCKTEWRPCNLYTVGVHKLPPGLDTAAASATKERDVAIHREGDPIVLNGPFTVVGGGFIADGGTVKT